ncbi:Regulator of protease activity HflC, stomatin/prohibitin superfamily [Paenibacillus sophorae]|uniref:Regulator of protease activity HflC, stomatin/prohibitin superfamily n=1 Tax=Paenibacillus sophorae TaxID=1333845 RepID=A0A1H8MD11_9BACL|nr:SPFH domain-containing protein [Paenibacillus sophorae]QWU17766.1 SPFH domain-containing protein [Paenibacillus sophorae]SEO15241.1 Regulator of protease activity HflC, stomatin/prohibitin superfamily [Paenibacillus sophorae]
MQEKMLRPINGFWIIAVIVICLAGGIYGAVQGYDVVPAILFVASGVLATSITVVQPNKSVVVTFFGKYVGTISASGMWAVVPLSKRKTVSLRVRNFNSVKLKVNDIEGNPIEIAAVVVFKVINSAKALFDVDKYMEFVEIQSETALRHVASKYPYDSFNGSGMSLRANAEEIAKELALELQERLSLSGVEVLEARLTHLAYSTEIASTMLQRQQASAILSARQIIVEGAVGMVDMAIKQLKESGVVELDEERKAAMINNLMVAIVSERGASPVINAGSLY